MHINLTSYNLDELKVLAEYSVNPEVQLAAKREIVSAQINDEFIASWRHEELADAYAEEAVQDAVEKETIIWKRATRRVLSNYNSQNEVEYLLERITEYAAYG